MTYLLIGIIIILAIALKIQQRRNIKEQVYWITQIVSSDGYISDNEKEKIVEFATRKKLSSERINIILQNMISTASMIKQQVEMINWNRRNGLDFESYMVKMATHRDTHSSYEINFWSGDKCVDGCYAKSNCDPDIIIKVKLNYIERYFAIECKWRKSFNNQGYIEIAKPYQLKHYRKCQKQWHFPVFIALGVGGNGNNPENIYLIPLDAIRNYKIRENEVQRFKKADCYNKLYFDINKSLLS